MKVECTVTNVPWFTKGKVYDCQPAPYALTLIGITHEIPKDDFQDLNESDKYIPWNLKVLEGGSAYMPGLEAEAAFKVVEE